jgi:hypothetical protein
VRVARTVQEYEHAFRLIHVGNVSQGIEPVTELGLRMTEQHVLPESTVLLAFETDENGSERVVGTMTVTLDSPAGLPLDGDFPEEVRRLRESGRRLAELGSFTVVRRCWKDGVAQLLSLAAARVAFRHMEAEEILIGIHPRGVPLYEAVWGFEPFARTPRNADVAVPTVALSVHRDSLRRHLDRHFKKPMATGCRPVEHLFEGPAVPGFELPEELPHDDLARWKMPREVFQALFVQRSDRLRTLSEPTREHLRRKRSDETLARFSTVGHVA